MFLFMILFMMFLVFRLTWELLDDGLLFGEAVRVKM